MKHETWAIKFKNSEGETMFDIDTVNLRSFGKAIHDALELEAYGNEILQITKMTVDSKLVGKSVPTVIF